MVTVDTNDLERSGIAVQVDLIPLLNVHGIRWLKELAPLDSSDSSDVRHEQLMHESAEADPSFKRS